MRPSSWPRELYLGSFESQLWGILCEKESREIAQLIKEHCLIKVGTKFSAKIRIQQCGNGLCSQLGNGLSTESRNIYANLDLMYLLKSHVLV